MVKYPAVLGALLLAGCSAYVANGTIDFNEAIEQETNELLVMNILRARDGVPTYYSDISQVRGTLTMGVSSSALAGIAQIGKSATRDSSTNAVSLSLSPSFDIAPLNTQEFTQGITEPLQLNIMQYYVDRGIPASILLYLMVDKIEVVKIAADGTVSVDRYYNTPCSDQVEAQNRCGSEDYNTNAALGIDNRFFVKVQPWLNYLILNSYTLMEPNGPPTKGEGANVGRGGGGLGGAPAAPQILRPVGGGAYQPFTSSDRVALCVPVPTAQAGADLDLKPAIKVAVSPTPFFAYAAAKDPAKTGPLYAEDPSQPHYFEVVAVPHTSVAGSPQAISDTFDPKACTANLVYAPASGPLGDVPAGADAKAPPAGRKAAAPKAPVPSPPRAQEHTVVYLRSVDSIVAYLGELLRLKNPADRPLPFDLSATPRGNTRFVVSYNGQHYYVGSRANTVAGKPDRTLEILTFLNQLINLNKKASELPSTRAVQSVP